MASALTLPCARAEEPQLGAPVKSTSGDGRREPQWEERVTVTVGKGGDFEGTTERAIQAAADYCTRLGGGTVKILPGTYTCRNSIFVKSGLRIVGSGAETVLFKAPSFSTTLAADTDWFDQEITLADARGFNVGDGVCLRTKNPHTGGMDVLRRTLIARSGNRFKLDQAPRVNFWMDQTPEVAALFPVITAEFQSDIAIENLAIDGNRENNANLNGNYGGGMWFQDCSDLSFRRVEARNYNGDGISWQICHDVLVEHCHSHGNADLGLHPGSGSQRPVMRNNRIENNTIGIFFCWGVREGMAEDNMIVGNSGEGVSIGHRDHYNIVRNNTIEGSGKVGVLFRPERGEGFTATGNVIEGNRILDSGGDDGIAIDLQGVTEGNTIRQNTIEERRGPAQRIGIRIGAEAGENVLEANMIAGVATAMVDLRKG
ncbi:MAG: right-handed parallel beta-helix repeat-containing protein [Candidatus Hydrogenedentes bacterium]|nr:right-handed parallel beta-helix repeat-containing protein [Candidatus Hydrogenedentota bacterium]